MATAAPASPAAPRARTRPRESSATWPLGDRIGLGLCWAAGIVLGLVVLGILVFMLVKGVQFLQPELLVTRPSGEVDQGASGGFLDPIVGTFALTAVGILIAAPLGVGVALWLVEYARPRWLAQVVDSCVEVIAGVPSIVLAIFGLIVFTSPSLGFLSVTPEGAVPLGRSFLIAGIVISLVALPSVISATREALLAVPNHVREASYALGKTKATTIRYVLLPAIRPGVATGSALGIGRIVGDTAIAIILLGATLTSQGAGGVPGLSFLRGTGSTMTTYVYTNSPAGEGDAPQKAYAAAFVLLVAVVLIQLLADRLTRGNREVTAWTR